VGTVLGLAHRKKRRSVSLVELCPNGGLNRMNKEKQTLSKWSANGMKWLALFVKTYEERRLADRLQMALDSEKYHVFVPTTDYLHKVQGKATLRKIPCFKGYVFIATSESTENCIKMVEPLLINESTIFRFVSYDRSQHSIVISDTDKATLTQIFNDDFHRPAILAEIVDGKVKFKENTLEQNGGKVLKITRGKKSVVLQVELLGEPKTYEVALELLAEL
jgi:transcriptional antiterminator NusG